MPRIIRRSSPYAVYINGANGSTGNALSCAYSATLNPAAAVTYGAWIMPTGAPKSFALFDNSDASVTTSPTIIIGSDGSFNWYSSVNGTTRNILNANSLRIQWNRWNFLTAGYNGSAIRMQLNGAQFTEETTGLSGNIGVQTGTFRIGAYVTGGVGLTFQGLIWRPQVWAAGVTLAEHRAMYYSDSMSTALQEALRLDGRMTEGSGSTSADASGNGNTMTLGASASWSTETPFEALSLAPARSLSIVRTLAPARTLIS